MAYWQAVTLADEYNDVKTAAKILSSMLIKEARKDHWIDLIKRLQYCGIIERQGAGDELLAQLDL
jgi:hypothetical protein